MLTRFITADDFRTSKMRGLNLSIVHNTAQLSAKNLPGARATGANHGRYWITVSHDANNVYSFVDPAILSTLDAALTIAEQQNFYIILTLQVKPTQGACDLWGNAARKNGVKKIWTDLAARYKDRKIIAAYDLINEPRLNTSAASGSPQKGSNKECIDWQIDVINGIRAVDPNHTIAVEVLGNSMLGDAYISNIVKIPNLIFSPHGYSYLAITHQGSSTTTRQPYPSTKYPSGMFSTNAYWKVMRDFMVKYNVPIWVGEFSCINWAPKNSAGQWTSTRWIEDAITYMESIGASWAYHAWREYQGWEADLPSSWYYDSKNGVTFSNAKPSKLPPSSARDGNAPTMLILKESFLKNKPL